MSQENVEIVRRWLDAFNRKDIEGCLELAHSQAEIDVSRASSPYAGVYRDLNAMRELLEGYFDAWESLVWRPERLVEYGDQCIVMPFRATASGSTSGVQVETKATVIWTLRDQRIVRMQLFNSDAEAYEAAGLSE